MSRRVRVESQRVHLTASLVAIQLVFFSSSSSFVLFPSIALCHTLAAIVSFASPVIVSVVVVAVTLVHKRLVHCIVLRIGLVGIVALVDYFLLFNDTTTNIGCGVRLLPIFFSADVSLLGGIIGRRG